MKNIIAIFFLVIFAPLLVFAQQDTAKPKDPWKNTRAGNGLYKTKDYNGAEQKYRDALKTDTSSPIIHNNLGNSLYEQKKYAEAEKEYEEAARNSSGDTASKAYYNLGNSRFQQGDLEGSAEAYKESLKLNPNDEDARHNLAMTQKMIKARKQGLKDTTGNFKKDPKGKYLTKDSVGNIQLKEGDSKKGDKDGKDGKESKTPLDPKKQSMSAEEARKVMSALKDSEQKTRQRLNQGSETDWYKHSRDKDW